MASTLLNVPTNNTLVLNRGRAITFPGFTATTQAWQFAIPQPRVTPNGLDILTVSVVGGTGTTGLLLTCSIDGGTTWFSVAGRTTGSTFGTTTIGSDTAVIAAVSYDVSGLAGGLFRVGVTGISAGTATVTGLISG